MRLTTYEQESIKNTFSDIFKNGEIYLFGSRIDNNKKGGDIDLYIHPIDFNNLSNKKINFLIKLK